MPQRKKNTKPGVFKRGATWSYKLTYTDEGTGKYRQRWVGGFATQSEAWAAKLEALSGRNRGDDLRPDKVTVQQYLERWLRDYAKGLPGERTHDGYQSLFKNHVYPVIGAVALRKLRPLQVQAIYTKMREKGLSEKTILNCHRPLSEALKHAVDWEVATRNVAAQVRKPKPGRYEPVIMPIEVVRAALKIAAGMEDAGGDVVRFAVYSGMRQGELIRMKRDHVQHEYSSVIIPKAKSKAGVRHLSQTPDGMAILEGQMLQRVKDKNSQGFAYNDEGYVFARPDGTPLTAGACEWAWEKVKAKLDEDGMPTEARFHDLRHAHACLLLSMGVHPKVVQERLGHASIQVTIDLYSHVMPGIHDAAILPLDALLAAPREGIQANEDLPR